MLKDELSKLDISRGVDKRELVSQIEQILRDHGFSIHEVEVNKPWGAYIRLSDMDATGFTNEFFKYESVYTGLPISPKILIVKPGRRLSWQYHHRRKECWEFITDGEYCRSDTDDLGSVQSAKAGDVIKLDREERHRLIGDPVNYTLVAEIWQHTDIKEPSNEDDIVRLEDDYMRS